MYCRNLLEPVSNYTFMLQIQALNFLTRVMLERRKRWSMAADRGTRKARSSLTVSVSLGIMCACVLVCVRACMFVSGVRGDCLWEILSCVLYC